MGTFMKATDDVVLECINYNLVSLRGDDKKEYLHHYRKALEDMIVYMKQEDKLFEAIFQRIFFAGSFYDGLKIGKPDEYDVDLVMKLPIDYDDIDIDNQGTTPPFIKIRATGLTELKSHPRYDVYKPMESWVDGHSFLLQTKFRAWMNSVIDKAIAALPPNPTALYTVSRSTSGPAVTLHFTVKIAVPIELDVDLVPVIEFSAPKWPPAPIRRNPFPDKESWFIVPKPSAKNPAEAKDTFWRFAFHEQEREMIENKMLLKPVCRLLKQLRDVENLQIASYYIKTVFLWQLQEKGSLYWSKSSLSSLFMDMLRKLRDHMKSGKINNFWDPRANLLDGMTQENVGERLDHIIRGIECRVDEYPNIFAKYLLTPAQLPMFLELCKPGH